jgi:carbonic anhydrase
VLVRFAKFAAASAAFCGLLSCPHSAGAQTKVSEPQWSYSESAGPGHWADLDPTFAACKAGTRQSPIDIHDAKESPDLAPIRFDYKLSPLKIVNTGRTLRINYDPGSSIVVNGISLPLAEFHFHHPSETEIDGKKFDMELQLVHQDPAGGRTAVVVILIKSGAENALLRDLLSHAPSKIGEVVDKKKVVINAAGFLPVDQNYYVFDGSLTTPPCSEPVKWYVLKQAIEASPSQITAFARMYPDNARPVEPSNDRAILESSFHK